MISDEKFRSSARCVSARIPLWGGCVLALLLAGCGGQAGSVSGDADPVSTRIGNLLAFNSAKAPDMPKDVVRETIECPHIQVETGASNVRVGGEESSSVRYQIAIGDVARECSVVDGKLLIRIGVETRTVIGPAGSPGTFSTGLRIAVRRVSDEVVLDSKTYRVGGTVGANGSTITALIADPLSVPYTNQHAADDYELTLALGEGNGASRTPRKKRR